MSPPLTPHHLILASRVSPCEGYLYACFVDPVCRACNAALHNSTAEVTKTAVLNSSVCRAARWSLDGLLYYCNSFPQCTYVLYTHRPRAAI